MPGPERGAVRPWRRSGRCRRGAKPHQTIRDTVLATPPRFRSARAAVGPGLAEIGQERQWPRRSAKVVLAIALDRLTGHYGMLVTSRIRAPMRSWRMEEA